MMWGWMVQCCPFNGLSAYLLHLFHFTYIIGYEVSEDSLGSVARGGYIGVHQGWTDNLVALREVNPRGEIVLYTCGYADEIIMLVEQGSKNIQLSEQQFNK